MTQDSAAREKARAEASWLPSDFTEDDTYLTGPLYASAAKIYPQKTHGTYRTIKWVLLYFTLSVYYLMPFIRWDRGPNSPDQAVLVDLANRRFYFFFIEIWPQEVYYFTGLLIIAAMTLFLMNAIAGRVWCGYLCWQTVWTDLFLTVERWVEGDRRARIQLDAAPWSAQKIGRKAAKHLLWLLIALCTGGAWVLYFADAPTLLKNVVTFQAPAIAYIWIGILTFTTYAFAGFMREQVCLYMCPWPRIQAALTDDSALNVTYRLDRGEPRMSVKKAAHAKAAGVRAGECVDCEQCLHVCPTGVDIRQGANLGCIQCGLCIDACDNVMAKIGRPKRLIAYDTDENIQRREQGLPAVYKIVRPRTILYAAILVVVAGLMLTTLLTRADSFVAVIHDRNPQYTTLSDGGIRNGFTVRYANKTNKTRAFALEIVSSLKLTVNLEDGRLDSQGRPILEVGPDQTREARLFLTTRDNTAGQTSTALTFRIIDDSGKVLGTTKDYFKSP